MSVVLDFRGRLGNNLFQYAFARIIAERHGLELACNAPRKRQYRFVDKFNLDIGKTVFLSDLASRFPNAPLNIPGRRFESPVRYLGDALTVSAFREVINGPPCRFECRGFFQKLDYYRPYHNQIRRWFAFNPMPTPFEIGPLDVLVNIRAGFDYHIRGWTLPLSFYSEALSHISDLDRVYLCGTGINDKVLRFFDGYNAVCYEGTPAEHFSFVQRFRRIVISNSTFAWWAAFLSDASEIYAPLIRHYHTVSFNVPTDKGRCHELPVELAPSPPKVFGNSVSMHSNETQEPYFTSNGISGGAEMSGFHTLDEWLERGRSINDFHSIAKTEGETLSEWVTTRTSPFSLIDIPTRFLRAAEGNPVRLLNMLFNTGLVRYLPEYLDC